MKIQWSFSSLKTFEQCPRKYYHTRVLKDIVEGDTEATRYGKLMHKIAEDYIKNNIDLPEAFSYLRSTLDELKSIPGTKYCEYEMGLREDLSPCEFNAEDRWWRGIADLLIIDEAKELAWSVDYKTSKNARYADTKQLDLVATGVFAHFPKIKRVKSALLFVVSKEFVRVEHYEEMVEKYLEKPKHMIERLVAAHSNGVWNPVESALCKFCAVRECEYNKS